MALSYQEIEKQYHPSYSITADWRYLEKHLEGWAQDCVVDLDPDFQRGHVWSEKQQILYVEYILSGGVYSRDIKWNCADWMKFTSKKPPAPIQLVDGKQRLTAALKFLRNELKAFGQFRNEFTGFLPSHASFTFQVHDLETRAEVLNWYLQLNAGGIAHTSKEIERVRAMLEEEQR